MSYESESYLCEISCVQLRKILARFWCGNTQLEVMLGAWKGVPYAKRLCQGYDLGKVEDEKRLFLVCPNTQKVRECFCLALPFTHISILAELMQTTNTVALAKFVACCQYQKTIYLPWFLFCLMGSLVPNGRKIIIVIVTKSPLWHKKEAIKNLMHSIHVIGISTQQIFNLATTILLLDILQLLIYLNLP